MIVTGHSEEKSAAAKRKAEQRARDEAAGIEEVEFRLGPVEAAMLREGQEIRGGVGGPYDRTEYIATLIRRDNELLRQQRGELEGRICESCRKPLPRGCAGVWGWDASCAHTAADKALKL